MDKSLLKEKLNEIDIDIDDKQLEEFDNFTELMLHWNKHISLTSITEDEEIIDKHYVDSLTLLKTRLFDDKIKVLDLGTGGGYPGIPLKIMRKDIEITLLDSRLKKIEYLENIVEDLKLEDVELIHERAENLGKNEAYRGKYDVVVSRAVADLASLSEYCLPFLKKDGFFIAMKGSDHDEELKGAEKAINKMGGSVVKVLNIKIPHSDIIHSLIIIRKVSKTPDKYPRRPGKPTKDPIK